MAATGNSPKLLSGRPAELVGSAWDRAEIMLLSLLSTRRGLPPYGAKQAESKAWSHESWSRRTESIRRGGEARVSAWSEAGGCSGTV